MKLLNKTLFLLSAFLFTISLDWAMEKKQSLYDILEIKEDATDDEIKRAYKKLALQWHPDRNKSPEAEEKFKEINAAYEILYNSAARKKYDVGMREHVVMDLFGLLQEVKSWFIKYPHETIYDFFGVAEDADLNEIEKRYKQVSAEKAQKEKAELAFTIMKNARIFYDARLYGELKHSIKKWVKEYPDESPFDFLGVPAGASTEEIQKVYIKLAVAHDKDKSYLQKLKQAQQIALSDKENVFERIKKYYERHIQINTLNKLYAKFNSENTLSKKVEIIDEIIKQTKKYDFDKPYDERRISNYDIVKVVNKSFILDMLQETVGQFIQDASSNDIQDLKKIVSIAEHQSILWKDALSTEKNQKYQESLAQYRKAIDGFEKREKERKKQRIFEKEELALKKGQLKKAEEKQVPVKQAQPTGEFESKKRVSKESVSKKGLLRKTEERLIYQLGVLRDKLLELNSII